MGFRAISASTVRHKVCAPGTQRRSRGFTLIELLVVLVIIAVVAGIAVLSIGALGKDPPAKMSAKRLTALLKIASEDAVMQGRELGLSIAPHSYRFLLYKDAQWQALKDDDLFRKRSVDNAVRLTLHLEGRAIALENRPDKDHVNQRVSQLKPDILLLSSGEMTPFELRMTSADSREVYRVTGSLNNGIRMHSPERQK